MCFAWPAPHLPHFSLKFNYMYDWPGGCRRGRGSIPPRSSSGKSFRIAFRLQLLQRIRSTESQQSLLWLVWNRGYVGRVDATWLLEKDSPRETLGPIHKWPVFPAKQFFHPFPLLKSAVVPTPLFEDIEDADWIDRIIGTERMNLRSVAPMLAFGRSQTLADAPDGNGLLVLDADCGIPSFRL